MACVVGRFLGLFEPVDTQYDYKVVPTNKRLSNELYLTASVLSHNLLHELQMRTEPRQRQTQTSRTPLWRFLHPQTWRARWLHRAGRLTRPAGRLTLTISGDHIIAEQFRDMEQRLRHN